MDQSPVPNLALDAKGVKYPMAASGNASYYPKDVTRKDTLVEVANVVYMEKKLYIWIPSLI